MESTTTTNIEPQSPVVETAAMANGNGAHKEQTATTTAAIAATIQSPEQQQRPRKLSFDDSDMEMTKLKLGATVRRFPTSVVLTAIAACTISLLIRCLLPFDFGEYENLTPHQVGSACTRFHTIHPLGLLRCEGRSTRR